VRQGPLIQIQDEKGIISGRLGDDLGTPGLSRFGCSRPDKEAPDLPKRVARSVGCGGNESRGEMGGGSEETTDGRLCCCVCPDMDVGLQSWMTEKRVRECLS